MDAGILTAGEDHPFWRDREAAWAEDDEWNEIEADDVVIVPKKPESQ